MKKLSLKYLSGFIVLLLVLWMSGCSSTDEKEPEDTAVATKAAESADDVKDTEDTAAAKTSKEQGETEPPVEEPEPVVEVMPGASKDVEVKVEPISKPSEPKEEPVTEKEISAAEPAPVPVEEEPVVAKQDIPVSTGPNHFVITAAPKGPSHPFYGKGHKMGFLVNGVPGKEIVMERGKTYRIDVATDPKHDVYISLKDIGWGSVPYSQGVEGMYTYKGTITVKPDDKTPDILFYSCRNHPYMGGKIHIVDPGETVKIAKRAEAKTSSTQADTQTEVTQADVNQKIMFANMLMSSKNSKSIANSNISEAVEMYKQAEKALDTAKSQLKAGDNSKAYKNAEKIQ